MNFKICLLFIIMVTARKKINKIKNESKHQESLTFS
jgi:hypothetical protein